MLGGKPNPCAGHALEGMGVHMWQVLNGVVLILFISVYLLKTRVLNEGRGRVGVDMYANIVLALPLFLLGTWVSIEPDQARKKILGPSSTPPVEQQPAPERPVVPASSPPGTPALVQRERPSIDRVRVQSFSPKKIVAIDGVPHGGGAYASLDVNRDHCLEFEGGMRVRCDILPNARQPVCIYDSRAPCD